MMNADKDKSEALSWAKQHKFNFPLVMFKKLSKGSALRKYSNGRYPNYVLINKDGKVITRGMIESKAKIETL